MDGTNPFMGMDPLLLQRLMGQGGGGVPGAMPNQMATGAQMPGAGGLMQGNAQQADRLQKLGKLLSAMGQFQAPPKPTAQTPMPQQPQAMPQMPMAGSGGMPQRLPLMPPAMPPQLPRVGPGMAPQGGMGVGRQQVPPSDVMNRLLSSLSQYGG